MADDKTEAVEAIEAETAEADDQVALCLWCNRDQATVDYCQRCGFSAAQSG